MLTAMRGATGGIIAKTFLVLLAGSFAVWGVADVFNGRSDEVLAKVGEREVGALEFRNFFDQRLQALGRQTGRAVTPAQARQFGFDRQILGDLLRGGALDEQAKALKLSVPDKYIAKQIAENPAFQDASGKFDAQALKQRLYNASVTEQQFVSNERNNMIRGTITSAISDSLEAPKTLVRLVAEQAREQRDVSYFTITGEGIEITEPSEKQLKAYHDKHPSLFTVPERRVFETMYVNAATLGKSAEVTPELLEKTYQREKARFGSPETRTIEQIPFANTGEAEAALKRIRDGVSFDAIAKEKGMTDKDKLLGTFTKADVPDGKIAEAAFKLKEGVVSEPVSGTLSTFLIRVSKITPANIKSKEEVRDQLVKIIQTEAGRDEIINLRDKVEDERGGGASFKEIAKSLGLTYKVSPPLNRAGMDESGKKFEGTPNWQKILQAGNESDVGLEVDPIATDDDGFVWVNVQEVIAAHPQKFEEAKAKAAKLWKAVELRKALAKKAQDIKKRADGGATFADLAKEFGAEIKKELGINRRTASADFDSEAVRAAFAVPTGTVTHAINPDGKAAKIMSVSPVLAPPYDPASAEVTEIATQLTRWIDDDAFAAYLAQLQKNVGVEINEKAWQRVFQGSSNN